MMFSKHGEKNKNQKKQKKSAVEMKFLLVHHGEEESFQKCLHASEFVTGPHRTQQGRLRFRPCCARIKRFVGDGRTDGRRNIRSTQ